jgi:hypothetical protein
VFVGFGRRLITIGLLFLSLLIRKATRFEKKKVKLNEKI